MRRPSGRWGEDFSDGFNDRDPRLEPAVRSDTGGRQRLLHRASRRGAGLSWPQRRRKIHHHEDDHRIPGAVIRHGGGLRLRYPRRADRGETPDRLSARRCSRISRHDAARLPALHCRDSRLQGRRRQGPHRSGGDAYRTGRRHGPADRHALQGVQAPRRPGASVTTRSRRAHSRRADRRPRSEPEA